MEFSKTAHSLAEIQPLLIPKDINLLQIVLHFMKMISLHNNKKIRRDFINLFIFN